MRKEKALIDMLRGLVDLLAEEAQRNPDFSSKLDALLAPLSERKTSKKVASARIDQIDLPDVHLELQARSETDFRLWLRDQDIAVLRTIVRAEDLDAKRRTDKWKDAEKLADFIADGLRMRQTRGAAFIRKGEDQ